MIGIVGKLRLCSFEWYVYHQVAVPEMFIQKRTGGILEAFCVHRAQRVKSVTACLSSFTVDWPADCSSWSLGLSLLCLWLPQSGTAGPSGPQFWFCLRPPTGWLGWDQTTGSGDTERASDPLTGESSARWAAAGLRPPSLSNDTVLVTLAGLKPV